jgi:hypothetical protein
MRLMPSFLILITMISCDRFVGKHIIAHFEEEGLSASCAGGWVSRMVLKSEVMVCVPSG